MIYVDVREVNIITISDLPPATAVNPDLQRDPPARVVVREVVVGSLQGLQQTVERPGPVVGQHYYPAVGHTAHWSCRGFTLQVISLREGVILVALNKVWTRSTSREAFQGSHL